MKAHIALGFLTHADDSETVVLYSGGDGQKAVDAYDAARRENPPRFARIGLARKVTWTKRMDLKAKRRRGFILEVAEAKAEEIALIPDTVITPLPQPLPAPSTSAAPTPAKPIRHALKAVETPALTLSDVTGDAPE